MPDTYSIDWVFSNTSTVYMNGTAAYSLRVPGKPGTTHLILSLADAERLKGYLEKVLEVIHELAEDAFPTWWSEDE